MNYCMLMAEIIVGPQLRYTQENQTPISELTISFPGLRPEEPIQQMTVVGWGNLAQEIQERYQVGDRVLIEGRLSINTVDRPEGFKEKKAELTAQKIHRLSDLGALELTKPASALAESTPQSSSLPSPVSTPAATPTASVPAAEPEVDYDDIPF
ncbi:MAG: single-stranded DNA-binding protein [Leptolyngbya sp. SIO1D8]|nr:single-stranded DNA-binding protein [Leptolyngbya sp. SIO1D8]